MAAGKALHGLLGAAESHRTDLTLGQVRGGAPEDIRDGQGGQGELGELLFVLALGSTSHKAAHRVS